jgi:stage III sporulation protein AB
MTKYIGTFLILYALTAIGWMRAEKIRKRQEERMYLKKLIMMLRGEINYHISSMGECFFQISQRIKEPYRSLFIDLSIEMEEGDGKEFSILWNDIVIKGLQGYLIYNRDLDNLAEIGSHLGYLDKEMQINYLNLYLDNLEESIQEGRKKAATDEKMNKVMGLMAGIFLVVLLW